MQPRAQAHRAVSDSLIYICLIVASAIIEKIIYSIKALGKPKYGYHYFVKPYFYTIISMIGTSLALIFFQLSKLCKEDEKKARVTPSSYELRLFAVPGILDLFQCVISCITVAFIGVSIDYMMKCGSIIAVAVISYFYFHKTFSPYQICGLILVGASLIIIGMSSMIGGGQKESSGISWWWTLLILILKFVSQIGYAVQLSFEQFFTQNQKLDSALVAGFEGCWSLIFGIFLMIPSVNFTPGTEDNGIHEDLIDTFLMIRNSWTIAGCLLFVIIVDCFYTVVSVHLISITSAVARTLIELLGTLLIWVAEVFIHYIYGKGASGVLIGEEWTRGSWIQLSGYLIMVFGLLSYKGILRYSCFDYQKPHSHMSEGEERAEPLRDNEDSDEAVI